MALYDSYLVYFKDKYEQTMVLTLSFLRQSYDYIFRITKYVERYFCQQLIVES